MTRLAALGLSAALVSTACGPSWPAVRASADPSFAAGKRGVRTVDVLPADVQIWTLPGAADEPEAIAESFDGHVAGALPGLLARRGYQVAGNLDWSGAFVSPRGFREQALSPQQLAETAHALSGYGVARERAGEAGLAPHLPHRLGAATGADATLYIGGWAYAGKKGESTGKKVAKGIAIGLVAAIIIVAVIAAVKGGGKGPGRIGGRVAGGAARGAVRVAGRAAGGFGRVALRLGRGAVRVAAEVARHSTIEIHAGSGSYGHRHTHVEWYAGRPDYYNEPGAPRRGRSAAMIEMTLIDNATGQVLWHARQRFPASPASPGDTRRVLETMIAAMPPA
jgi:hypothetical protein